MIINDFIEAKKNTVNAVLENLNEAKTINLGGGSVAYQYGGKYYIKKGTEKREISADQYNKLLSKGTISNEDKVKSTPKSKINDILLDDNNTAGDKFYKIINDKGTRNYFENSYGQYVDWGYNQVFKAFDGKSPEEINSIIDNDKSNYYNDTLTKLSKFISKKK